MSAGEISGLIEVAYANNVSESCGSSLESGESGGFH